MALNFMRRKVRYNQEKITLIVRVRKIDGFKESLEFLLIRNFLLPYNILKGDETKS